MKNPIQSKIVMNVLVVLTAKGRTYYWSRTQEKWKESTIPFEEFVEDLA